MNKGTSLLSKRKKKLFIVSAPSGTGKTSLCSELVRKVTNLSFAVSHTTRPPRPGEQNGKNYYFLSPKRFERNILQKKMAEWTRIYGYCYGTCKQTIQKEMQRGNDVLLDIDERGARQLLKQYPESVTILILPPSLHDLKKRLLVRGSDDKQSISIRFKQAKEEIARMDWYRYVVVNDQFDEALLKLQAIIIAERCRNPGPAKPAKKKFKR